ncbi:MAG: hypothetical protein ACNS62_14770 [Candidatus Cyclobacteriaceae bacterium M3_2C_046]
MKKFMNSLAICRYNQETQTIEIEFNGAGDLNHYRETMKVGLDIAAVNQVSRWLIKKSNFKDLSTAQFFDLIKNWLMIFQNTRPSNKLTCNCQVTILTKIQAKKKFNQLLKYDKLLKNRLNDNIKINIVAFENKLPTGIRLAI